MIDFSKYAKTPLRVTKMIDNRFFNDHPNKINEGSVHTGFLHLENSSKYQCLFMVNLQNDRYFHTSEVKKIDEREGYDLVHTLNSIYKVEMAVDAIPGVQEKYSVKIENDEQQETGQGKDSTQATSAPEETN